MKLNRSLRQPGVNFIVTFDQYFTGITLEERSLDLITPSGYVTDWMLQKMAEMRGFDGLPTVKRVIDPATIHPVGILYRGVSNPAAIHSFKYGDYTPTVKLGSFGHGTYAACEGKLHPWWNAINYANNNAGNVMRLALQKDARVIEFESLVRIRDEEQKRLLRLHSAMCRPSYICNRLTAIEDIGRAAVYFGFDAVRLQFRLVNEINILNRSAVLVQSCACAAV